MSKERVLEEGMHSTLRQGVDEDSRWVRGGRFGGGWIEVRVGRNRSVWRGFWWEIEGVRRIVSNDRKE